jgi:AAA domain
MADARSPNLVIERFASTWSVRHTNPAFPVVITARDTYFGTGRLLVTLRAERHDSAPVTRLLVESVDLMTESRRKRFATEVASRLGRGSSGDPKPDGLLVTAILTMVEALLERLLDSRDEIITVDVSGLADPSSLKPGYAVWPIVPQERSAMLLSPSGSQKSLIAAGLAIGVLIGRNLVPGTEVRVHGPVLFVAQEEGLNAFHRKVVRLRDGHNLGRLPPGMHFAKVPSASLVRSAPRLAELIARKGVVLTVLDSAQSLWSGITATGIREAAGEWFDHVQTLGCPVLIVEHPNLAGSRKGAGVDTFAAGTSVKRDRAGHTWTVESTELAPTEGLRNYSVLMRDVARNEAAQQDDIAFQTQYDGSETIRFLPASPLSANVAESDLIDRRLVEVIAAVTSERDPGLELDEAISGITVKVAASKLNLTDRVVRRHLQASYWRRLPGDGSQRFRFSAVEGTGTHHLKNPQRFQVEVRSGPTGAEVVS